MTSVKMKIKYYSVNSYVTFQDTVQMLSYERLFDVMMSAGHFEIMKTNVVQNLCSKSEWIEGVEKNTKYFFLI